MKHRFRITSRARRDIIRIGGYFAHIDHALASRFLDAVYLSCQRISQAPDLGEVLLEKSRYGLEYRGWSVRGFGRYVIYYSVRINGVEIVRVLHSAQDAETEI